MTAEGVPVQSGVVGPQRGKTRSGQPAALKPGIGVRLLDPTESATAADAVVDGEGKLVAVEVGGALAPAGTFGRDRVLPRRGQPGNARPRLWAAEFSAAEPLQRVPPWCPARYATHVVGVLGKAPSRSSHVVVARHVTHVDWLGLIAAAAFHAAGCAAVPPMLPWVSAAKANPCRVHDDAVPAEIPEM